MKEGETVSNYHSRLISIVNQMRRNDEQLEDVRVIEKMLRSLTPSFEHVLMAIEESKNLEIMTIEELLGSLRVHEFRIRKHANNADCEQALELKMTYENNGGRRGKGRGSPAHRGRGRGGGRGNPIKTRSLQFGEGKSTVQCWNCKQLDHYASECPSNDDNLANIVEGSKNIEEEPTLLFVHDATLEGSNMWYLNSGASNHVWKKGSFC